MEKGIGETFIFNGERYMVCEHTAKNVNHCWNCAFRHVPCGILDIDECGRKYRSDNKDVFFYKIVDDKENENMDKKIDLTELLKDCPLETRFYMSVLGEQVKLDSIKTETEHPIIVKAADGNIFYLSKYGQLFAQYKHGDCILWPSEECRDWSKFKAPAEKFDYSTLKPFDKVLVRDGDCGGIWRVSLFSCMLSNGMLCECHWDQGIPYNDETKHLVGTTDMPDEKYVWWEE